jgi:hypothetical protein
VLGCRLGRPVDRNIVIIFFAKSKVLANVDSTLDLQATTVMLLDFSVPDSSFAIESLTLLRAAQAESYICTS